MLSARLPVVRVVAVKVRIALRLNGGGCRVGGDECRSRWLLQRTSWRGEPLETPMEEPGWHVRLGLAGRGRSRRSWSNQICVGLRLERHGACRTAKRDFLR